MNDGGPAFPFVKPENWNEVGYGMSLRDYFAGQAIAGLMAAGEYNESREGYSRNAKDAYEIADAMLKARES